MKNKVTKEDLLSKISDVQYVIMPDGRTTICQLTMKNGFTVRGESSCVSIDNFNKEVGEDIAYNQAIDKAWAFEGYLLADKLAGKEELLNHMANKFLGVELPKDFSPDCGISFTPLQYPPSGTNLFHYSQIRDILEKCME